MTEQAIGSAVGVTQPTINRIRRDLMQPTYEVGKALVDLAAAKASTPKKKGVRRAA